jgi:uncharacterized protein (TIGR03643 family)
VNSRVFCFKDLTFFASDCFTNMLQEDIDRVIEMAWEDRTPFDAIRAQFGLSEKEVIELMRNNLTKQSWKRWRERVQGRKTKHRNLRVEDVDRFKCTRQWAISSNKVSKRLR